MCVLDVSHGLSHLLHYWCWVNHSLFYYFKHVLFLCLSLTHLLVYYLSPPLTYQVLASTPMVHKRTCNRVLIHVTKNKQTKISEGSSGSVHWNSRGNRRQASHRWWQLLRRWGGESSICISTQVKRYIPMGKEKTRVPRQFLAILLKAAILPSSE